MGGIGSWGTQLTTTDPSKEFGNEGAKVGRTSCSLRTGRLDPDEQGCAGVNGCSDMPGTFSLLKTAEDAG